MELPPVHTCPQVIDLAGRQRNATPFAVAGGGLFRCANHRLPDYAEFTENGFRIKYRMSKMKLIPILVLYLIYYSILFNSLINIPLDVKTSEFLTSL